jgi:hypothetical protein
VKMSPAQWGDTDSGFAAFGFDRRQREMWMKNGKKKVMKKMCESLSFRETGKVSSNRE